MMTDDFMSTNRLRQFRASAPYRLVFGTYEIPQDIRDVTIAPRLCPFVLLCNQVCPFLESTGRDCNCILRMRHQSELFSELYYRVSLYTQGTNFQ